MFRIFAQMMITHTQNSWNNSNISVCSNEQHSRQIHQMSKAQGHTKSAVCTPKSLVSHSKILCVLLRLSEIKMRSQCTKISRFDTRHRVQGTAGKGKERDGKCRVKIVKISLQLIFVILFIAQSVAESLRCTHCTPYTNIKYICMYGCRERAVTNVSVSSTLVYCIRVH